MKDQEERDLNGEVTSNMEEPPVKAADGEKAEEQEEHPSSTVEEGESVEDGVVQNKEAQACDTAQGALGQVKAKVEVCKDESIGEDFESADGFFHFSINLDSID